MNLPTLYKKNASGTINQWTIIIENNSYWTSFGKVGGILQESDKTYCDGKNIGKANETTPSQQAILEASSIHKRKIEREGFVELIDDVDKVSFEPPMLAKIYDGNYTSSMRFIQPKLDGIRCNISYDNGEIRAISRHNLKFESTKHIEESVAELLQEHPTLHLDGELYNHNLHDDFNRIVSLVKRNKLFPNEYDEIRSNVEYHIYDLWFDDNEGMPFYERNEFIKNNLANLPYIVRVPTFEVRKHNDIEKYFQEFRADGYEGAIIRTDEPYQHKRSSNLLKYKKFQDDEFEILAVNKGKNNSNIAESMTIRLHDGQECNATLSFTDEECKEIIDNQENYIGKLATVRYFGYTNKGMLRFPIVKTIDRNNYE